MSIKHRLLLWLTSALLGLSALFITGTYVVERITITHAQDERLERIALSIPAHLKGTDLRSINVKLYHGRDDFLLQIWSRTGEIYQSHADITLPKFAGQAFSIQTWRGERWKVFVRHTPSVTIEVAQSLDARAALAQERAIHSIIPLLLLIPFLALGIPVCVDRGLASLTRLSSELERRRPDRLDPVGTGAEPPEIRPLFCALDTLFQRLRDAADLQRHFIADASHELRTPLAALQLQAQLLERAEGPEQRKLAFAALKSGIQRTGRLADQLLLISQLEAGTDAPSEIVDLRELARETVVQMLPFAISKEIDLGLGRADRVSILGSAYQLTLLIRNLVDNAIRYTPPGGQIDVIVSRTTAGACLTVEDSGPGILPDQHERVFDRFYRCLGNTATGSGLGLAIVRQIAERHQAPVMLQCSERLGGLRVIVPFSTELESATEELDASARLRPRIYAQGQG